MDEEILQSIQDAQKKHNLELENAGNSSKKKHRYLIFKMNDGYFAIPSDITREIITDFQVYSLPFVPDYICGVINRHGQPFTVVDLMIMQGGLAQDSKMFVVMNNNENCCIKITDIVDFCDLSESDLSDLPVSDEITIFSHSFLWKGTDVLVIDVNEILRKMVLDLSNE